MYKFLDAIEISLQRNLIWNLINSMYLVYQIVTGYIKRVVIFLGYIKIVRSRLVSFRVDWYRKSRVKYTDKSCIKRSAETIFNDEKWLNITITVL